MPVIEADMAEEPEYQMLVVRAKVVDQQCCVRMVGIKTPKTIREFTVIFETVEGEMLKLAVPEEMYEGFEIGQSGTLSLVEGKLYGFSLDDPSAGTEE